MDNYDEQDLVLCLTCIKGEKANKLEDFNMVICHKSFDSCFVLHWICFKLFYFSTLM